MNAEDICDSDLRNLSFMIANDPELMAARVRARQQRIADEKKVGVTLGTWMRKTVTAGLAATGVSKETSVKLISAQSAQTIVAVNVKTSVLAVSPRQAREILTALSVLAKFDLIEQTDGAVQLHNFGG